MNTWLAIPDPDVMMGPLVSREAQQRVLRYMEIGREEGATLRFGGGVPEGMERGAFVEPTMFADVNNSMKIAREEIFGPVVSVIPVDSEEEALAVANDTPYGLAASVLDVGYVQGTPVRPGYPGGHSLGEYFRRRRYDPALRRLQAVW